MKSITKCRACKSRNLDFALNLKNKKYCYCKDCTLLQRAEDIPFELFLNFEGRRFELDYYPAFLEKHDLDCVTDESVVFFSYQAIESLLNRNGYDVVDAAIQGTKLIVTFDRMPRWKRIKFYEQSKKLTNKFTYFLYAIKNK